MTCRSPDSTRSFEVGAAAATQNGEVDAALIEQVICRRRVKRVADAGARVRCPESEEDAGGYTPGVPGIQVDIDGPFLEQPAFHAAMPHRPTTQS